MKVDHEGFTYPHVDMSRCVDCHLCENVCPAADDNLGKTPLRVYAALNEDDNARNSSSSGGVFSALCDGIIGADGVVFGAAYDSDLCVRHISVDTKSECQRLRGSKYVQSDSSAVFIEAEHILKTGRMVLFSGTPCQVKAFRLFLKKDYDNLVLVDTICHGVPSPRTFIFYKSFCVSKLGGELSSLSFRHKVDSWRSYRVKVESNNGERCDENYIDNPYMRLFLRDISIRPSCFSCQAKSGRSYSDLTLGDFWGIEKTHPEWNDDKGLNAVLINTVKGLDFFESLRGVIKHRSEYSDVIQYNPSIAFSAKPNADRDFFFWIQKLTRNFNIAYHCTISQRLVFKGIRQLFRFVKRCI